MNFKNCLEKGLLKKIEPQEDLFRKELKEAEEDLGRARHTFKVDEDFKWTIIKAYYSMFHAAKGILYLIGLKERSHKCVALALNELSKKGLIQSHLVEELRVCKDWRESADYRHEYSKERAKESLSMAERFLKKMKGLSKEVEPGEI